MLLESKQLLAEREASLVATREKLAKKPGLAHIWVGNDPQTATFVRLKKAKAQKLNCEYWLHDFEQAENRQLEALIKGLNGRKDVDGIVLQLPLPAEVDRQRLINIIDPLKDVDNLRGDAPYPAPTPAGIINLLQANGIDPATRSTVILGDGLLVGRPLADMFRQNCWPFEQINSQAESQATKIRQHDLLISCTGVSSLVAPAMVNQNMIVIDGSGVDVDVKSIEPLVAAITPAKGAVGPLTIIQLFANLFEAAGRSAGNL